MVASAFSALILFWEGALLSIYVLQANAVHPWLVKALHSPGTESRISCVYNSYSESIIGVQILGAGEIISDEDNMEA